MSPLRVRVSPIILSSKGLEHAEVWPAAECSKLRAANLQGHAPLLDAARRLVALWLGVPLKSFLSFVILL